MSKLLSRMLASELGKGVTTRARVLNWAMRLPGRDRSAAQAKALKAEHAALLDSVEPKSDYAWLDTVLKKK